MPDFTKGKWHVVNDDGYLYVSAGNGTNYKDVCSIWSENEHDANLIASAPELYSLVLHLSECQSHEVSDLKMIARELVEALQ